MKTTYGDRNWQIFDPIDGDSLAALYPSFVRSPMTAAFRPVIFHLDKKTIHVGWQQFRENGSFDYTNKDSFQFSQKGISDAMRLFAKLVAEYLSNISISAERNLDGTDERYGILPVGVTADGDAWLTKFAASIGDPEDL